jgi:LysR family hydrogen peroxide-inducible transcriptional activator
MEHPALPTLRQLGYLVELSVRLNFRVAAEGQFVTQSTMSAGIKELETVLGVQLVERDNRNVRLTAIGEDVAARAKELLASATDLAEAARAAKRPLSGPLRLGAIPTIAPYLLPRVLPALRRVHGDLKLYLREDVTKVLLERLRAGGLDVALIALPFDTGDLYVRELFRTSSGSSPARPIPPSARRTSPSGGSTPPTCCFSRKGTACATTRSPPAVRAAAPGSRRSRPPA